MKALFSALALNCLALVASAQTVSEPQFTSTCQEGGGWRNGGENQQFCETRDLTMPAPAGQPLRIEGGANGGITVHGWDGPNVRIRAKVTSWAPTEAEAQARVKTVSIATANSELRATSTEKNEQYAVSYEVFVPRRTTLALNTMNGGISLDNLLGDVKFHATNGGVSLRGLGGQVTGQTVNGGLSIALTGTQWDGKGLDIETTNGGISWKLPKDYSAQLFTSTNMGNIRANMPVTRTGFLRREMAITLGKGGAPVRAITTNGGVTLRQEGQD
ncbi:DUF4097 family beta strand repeat-containing protein [Hymenobacter sp. M29]|uniref:DUF4097 family beta strand repeat-containing protein n=1 Tax=Hymenobacter mellowenesis TaxID=3063995 RepID=A0ABT9A7M3_9BACT|nr:DUF4097 family beta strand repeat-containing protein [Hymenobacter sp. M29]MDO7845847.1 DUF4097 family beta strand repeat-containing protein [Hymenobacter sp. M29]